MTADTVMALTLPRPAETSLAAVLVLATSVWIGVAQARRMTRLRQKHCARPGRPS